MAVALCSLIFLFGLFISIEENIVWAILFLVPLVCQFFKWPLVRSYAVWLGVFLVIQSLISPLLGTADLKLLVPNITFNMTVKSGIPGISGDQTITTDGYGFRTTKPINYAAKPDTTVRIFAIGASTTIQIELDDLKTWTHLMQTQLGSRVTKNIEVINTGVSGTRVRHHYATLRYISQFDPDIVIVLAGINDWNRHIIYSQAPMKTKLEYLKKPLAFDQSLLYQLSHRIKSKVMPSPPPSVSDLLGMTEINHGEYYDGKRQSLAKPIVKHFRPNQVYREYSRYLAKMAEFCKKRGIELVLLTQPTGYQSTASEGYKALFWMTPFDVDYTLPFEELVHISQLYNQAMLDFGKEYDVRVIDLAAQMPASTESFHDDCHFNENGARKVAGYLSKTLQLGPF